VEGKMAAPKKRNTVRHKALRAEFYGLGHENAASNRDRTDLRDAPERRPSALPMAPLASAHDTICYIGDMTSELRNLADRSGLPFLAYLLDIVVEEANAQCASVGSMQSSGRPRRNK
jgi:hypothetical protein